MVAHDPDNNDPPLDPAAERLRRKLARLLAISGGFMILGLIAVFAAIVYRLNATEPDGTAMTAPSAGVTVENVITIPDGARVISTALDGSHALITLEATEGQSLMLVEMPSGRVLGRYSLGVP